MTNKQNYHANTSSDGWIELVKGDRDDYNVLVMTEAIRFGHFKLASGRHSPVYFQCARLFIDPKIGERLCKKLAETLSGTIQGRIDMCIAPALGGVIVGYEVARHLGCKSIFFERKDGTFSLRRGFEIPRGARVIVVEDVVTTGGSLNTCIQLAREHGAEVVAACSLIERVGSQAVINVPYISLLSIRAPSFSSDEIPDSLAAIPVTAPGSSTKLTSN